MRWRKGATSLRFEEEAELFLRLGGYDAQWRVRESCAGELVSMLYGPCKAVKSMA
jgi:hypothetical protein